MSNWTIVLLGLLAFFVIRGLMRGKRRRRYEQNRALLGDNSGAQTASLIGGIALTDFLWHRGSGDAASYDSGYHGYDASSAGGGFDGGGFDGGGSGGGGDGG